MLHPFYVFELVTVVFWMADDYYYYSGCILLIQAISITVSMVQTRRVRTGGVVTWAGQDREMAIASLCVFLFLYFRKRSTSITW